MLVPELASGAAAELDGLRAACRDAIRSVAGPDRLLLVLGPGLRSRLYDSPAGGSFADFGVPLTVRLGGPGAGPAAGVPLAPALAVAAWLVADALGPDRDAQAVAVGPDYPGSATEAGVDRLVSGEREVALVVAGDGSARRSDTAPGYLDERAAGFDQGIATALAGGDADALARVDLALADELLAAGGPAWRAAGRLLAGPPWSSRLAFDDAPYGVGYFVASWLARDGR
jgi:hypothetical protein